MRYTFTRHARQRMRKRGINTKEIKTIVGKGQKWFCHRDQLWHAKMLGIEVVFVKEKGMIVVVTCFHER
ncbi:DUF4258 domain-containing protein [Candidatus Micrarchaeota archaeon]|nr:DUF4258 domain-containing protein [Candidatus Micrarchaeota archaeon]